MENIHTACPSPFLYMVIHCPFLSVALFQKENVLKTAFVQYFGLLEMKVALRWVSTSRFKVILSGLSEARVFTVICVHRKLLSTSV